MRYLTAILGVLAMLVTLSEPVAALAVKAPCHDGSMADMVMADDMASCTPAAKACTEPCIAVGNCQSPCGSPVSFVSSDLNGLALPLFTLKLHMAEGEHPPGTDSPVDGPPPRI